MNQPIKNQQGQVALFVAIVFQVLFIFFAMIVNVGLIVHHKINLQNSVDLAAYYGAMKQAEMLNAISHINYQIRQSYKLLTFRYEQLGNAGVTNQHPFDYQVPGGRVVREDETPIPFDPTFCIAYTPVSIVNKTETYCKDAGGTRVTIPGVNNFFGDALGFFGALQNTVNQVAVGLERNARNSCQRSMAVNYIMLAKMITAYKFDIANRKQLLISLANSLSVNEPTDIEGGSIKTGVYKTLLRNMTYQNQDSLRGSFGPDGSGTGSARADFEFYNSLASDECGLNGGGFEPPKWLKEVNIYPLLFATDADCTSDLAINFQARPINVQGQNSVSTNAFQIFGSALDSLKDYIYETSGEDPTKRLYKSTLGFEKNPWCVSYVGVKAKATPKIPFSPLGDVTITARAFSKPFGGRIGPWYGQEWPSGAEQSSDAKKTDELVPLRVGFGQSSFGNPNDPGTRNALRLNHARFTGDRIGILSNLTMAYMSKAIHDKSQTGGIKLEWYDHLGAEDFTQKGGGNGDPLAWDKQANAPPTLRDLEISAIAPDQFDISNYSIDPNFYYNYLLKIKKGYENKFSFAIRGDIGARAEGTDDQKAFSVRDQIQILNTKLQFNVQDKLAYYVTDFANLLTGWDILSPDDYTLQPSRFGKCGELNSELRVKETERDPERYVPGSCYAGGRTGYSVKTVDGRFLANEVNGQSQTYELGGKGVNGPIKNPPPAGF